MATIMLYGRQNMLIIDNDVSTITCQRDANSTGLNGIMLSAELDL